MRGSGNLRGYISGGSCSPLSQPNPTISGFKAEAQLHEIGGGDNKNVRVRMNGSIKYSTIPTYTRRVLCSNVYVYLREEKRNIEFWFSIFHSHRATGRGRGDISAPKLRDTERGRESSANYS